MDRTPTSRIPHSSPSPFAPSGRMASDAQLPPRRAARVLIDDPDVCARLGIGGVWHNGRVRSDVPPGLRHLAGMDDVVRALVARMEANEASMRAAIALAKATTHGAIREGLRASTRRGERRLDITGGRIVAFRQGPDGEYVAGTMPVVAPVPLRFRVVASGGLIAPPDVLVDEVPDVCAGDADGATVAQQAGTYRVDLLCVIPDDDDGVGWYLLLGAPTDVTRLDEVHTIQSPPVPAVDGVGVLPLYRVITRGGAPNVSSVVQVANRVNGV